MFKFDPYSAVVDANPFPLYKILRDEYPCYFSEEGNCWVLSRYQDIVDANNNHDIFHPLKAMQSMTLQNVQVQLSARQTLPSMTDYAD